MLSKRFRNEMYESVLQINHFKSDDAHQEDQSTCISNRVFSSQFEYIFFLWVCWLGWQASWITDACLLAECLTGYGTWDDTSLTISHELFLLTLHNSSVLLQLGPSRWFKSKTRGTLEGCSALFFTSENISFIFNKKTCWPNREKRNLNTGKSGSRGHTRNNLVESG